MEFDPILVHDWLSRTARRLPDKVALVCKDRRLTYRQLDEQTDRFAAFLIDHGVRRHERIVVFMGNTTETVISIYGILKAGAVFVMLNESLKAKKLAYILDNCDAKILITDTGKASVVQAALEQASNSCKIVWSGPVEKMSDEISSASILWDSIFAHQPDRKAVNFPNVIDIDLAALIYTSGSNGEPKGVMCAHHNMISAARSVIQYMGNSQDDVILDVLPLSFGYGLYQVIMAFMFGGTVVLEKSLLFLHPVLELIARERVTGFPIVPTIAASLLKIQDFGKYDFSNLRYITNAGAALPVDHVRKLRQLLPSVRLISMYGLTECKRVCYMDPDGLDGRPDSVGMAMPNCEVFIVDQAGNEVAPGEKGEMVIRGSNVMQGYWSDPAMTEATFRPGRYPTERLLHSGDIFRRDKQGLLYFLSRKDDMIKCKGERISAREVENVICSMESVSDVTAVGVPDEILGQAIKAFIVTTAGTEANRQDIMRFCTANLESFMIPKYIEFVAELPKTANGKIDKKKLVATTKKDTAQPSKNSPGGNERIISDPADDPDLGDVVDKFIELLPGYIKDIKTAFEQSDLMLLEKLVHDLKGSGDNVGLPALTEKAAIVEKLISVDDFDRLSSAIEQLKDICQDIIISGKCR